MPSNIKNKFKPEQQNYYKGGRDHDPQIVQSKTESKGRVSKGKLNEGGISIQLF